MHRYFFDSEYLYHFHNPKSDSLYQKRLPQHKRVEVIDLSTNEKYYSKYHKDDWSKLSPKLNLNQVSQQPTKTGRTEFFNNIECIEYSLENKSGETDFFYVDESTPFVNYNDFSVIFDGFVMKSKRTQPGLGKVEWEVEINKVSMPVIWLSLLGNFHIRMGGVRY